ncbi:hypothetical protein [Sinorhizobium americanum]|uniref:Surface polysaccharide/antigen n=1 Tax=Sinorhizobium americanum TaxID=194963 RepID=A0A1L3LV59_9HYPH|nr:hypothetical protein [Sinorhizobium americanum]APG93952.1 surface polysaccharide/antigen [Sinorhizobium americanum]OAP34061.1 hypothetical protein ATC00_28635 [Sinorhizobium americanum]
MVDIEQALPLASQPAGRIMRAGRVVACHVDDTLLLVIGTGDPLAGELAAEINDDAGAAFAATIIGWRLTPPQVSATHGFAALVPMNAADRALTTIRFGEEATARRYLFTPRPVTIGVATAILTDLAGSHLTATVESLVDVLMKGPTGRRRLSAVIALLQSGSGRDGFIELLGESHEGPIFLSGWGRHIVPGVCRAVVGGDSPAACECAIATFSRQDVPEGAAGFVGLLSANEPLRARDIEGLLYRTPGAWRYVRIHQHRTIAGPTETPGHIRSVLLQTHSSPEVLLRLRAAANSFDGRETVSTLSLPVRMDLDNVFQVNGGLLISGWLLDPDSHVQGVRLCCQRAAMRIDDRWTRIDRSDVTDAFTDQPSFRNGLEGGGHGHGFLIFADRLAGGAQAPLHLELTLRDSRRAFLPLTPLRIPARAAVLRQLKSIDPTDWALPEIIDRQIVPFLSGSERPLPTVGATLEAGSFDRAGGPPIVVAVGDSEGEAIAPFLGLLALDPETRRAPIALVLTAERFRRQAARIRRLAEFYQLSLRLMSTDAAGDVYDLLEAGARALTRETVVLLAGSLLPHRRGWYGKLAAAHATRKGSIISPTLAYEDHSVRWAGSWPTAEAECPPSARYAGYPLGALAGLKLTQVAAASLDCCILPRESLLLAGGFAAGYLGSGHKGLDLGLRLGRSGTESYWLPSVQMLGSDEASGVTTAATAALMERIDQRMFSIRWAAAPAGETEPRDRPSAKRIST